jgi:hypothetical protein
MKCFHCGQMDFRISRLRKADALFLLRGQFPVRCRTCHARMFTSLWGAWRIHRRGIERRAVRHVGGR